MHASNSPPAPRLLTRANALTFARLVMAPVLAAAVLDGAFRLAAALYVLGVASDFADGRVARRRGEASALGGLLDHATDAAFVTLGLIGLAWVGAVPLALPPLIALAFAQYALDSRALAGRALRPSPLGRWNGIAYYVLLGIPLLRDAVRLGAPDARAVYALGVALAVTTVLSIADRARLLWLIRRSSA